MRNNSVPDVKYFVIIKMCHVHNQRYDISCATLYLHTVYEILLCKVNTTDMRAVGSFAVIQNLKQTLNSSQK